MCVFFLVNYGKKLGCVLYMGAYYTRVNTVHDFYIENTTHTIFVKIKRKDQRKEKKQKGKTIKLLR